MKLVESLPIAGAHVVAGTTHRDDRGMFGRLYEAGFFAALGCDERLLQVNLSRTPLRGCARGMHMQRSPRSGFKLVVCLRGTIWDVCLDARAGSPTEGRWEGRMLDSERQEFLLIPPGCAHGFQTLSDDVEILYLMGEDHDPASEIRIQLQDPELAISWPLPISMLSPADADAPRYQKTSSRTVP